MALVVGTNSYVDIPFADSYFGERYNDYLVDWADIEYADKEKLLITATTNIDAMFTLSGEKADPNQQLEFPRYDPDDSSPVVPDKVKYATCELALYIYNFGSDFLPSPTSIKLDKMRIDLQGQGSMFPVIVSNLMREYGEIMDPTTLIQVVNLVR